MTIAELLSAGPFGGCVFCGYNGTGYYQTGTHPEPCPWRTIGGLDARAEALPEILGNYFEGLVPR